METARAGARVVLAARRADLLADAVDEAGSGSAVSGDVRREEDCRRIVEEAAGRLGEIDLVLYTVGTAQLGWLGDTTAEAWQVMLETNVVGFNQVARAAVSAMSKAGMIVALSSESVGQAWIGLGAYSAGKAAVEQSILSWRAERPEVRFSCVTVGATVPTGFGDSFDPEILGQVFEHWGRLGLLQEEFMSTGAVARVLAATLGVALASPDVSIEHLRLRSPSRVVGSAAPVVPDTQADSPSQREP